MALTLRLLCPAKINLHLRVGPRRDDGFHPLLSWMCTVGLFDTLTLDWIQDDPGHALSEAGRPGADFDELSRVAGGADDAARPIELVCDSPDLPRDERNLVVWIAAAWGKEAPGFGTGSADATRDVTAAKQGTGRVDEGDRAEGGQRQDLQAAQAHQTAQGGRLAQVHGRLVRAALAKRIPVGAGLGGGSSDAARTLLGLNHLSRAGRSADDLSAFAARFGSDLSFFLHGPSSVCKGREKVVRPIARPAARWTLLVLPPIVMPTADVYRRFDEMRLGRERDVTDEPDWKQWATLGAADLLPRLVNDLEPPAFSLRPDLDELHRSIERAIGRTVRMSGSGSSLFSLFDQREEADDAARRVREQFGVRVESIETAPRIEDDLADV